MPVSCIRSNGLVVAQLDEAVAQFQIISGVNITAKMHKLIGQINLSRHIVARIARDHMNINIDSTEHRPVVGGIAPGCFHVESSEVYARKSLPGYFLYVVIAFEVINGSNNLLHDLPKHVSRYQSAGDFARACEVAEYEGTYKVIMEDIKRLVRGGELSVPFYVPYAMEKKSVRGMGVRLLSGLLPAKFMIRYLAPMTQADWLTETSRKPWIFCGESHAENYAKFWRQWQPVIARHKERDRIKSECDIAFRKELDRLGLNRRPSQRSEEQVANLNAFFAAQNAKKAACDDQGSGGGRPSATAV